MINSKQLQHFQWLCGPVVVLSTAVDGFADTRDVSVGCEEIVTSYMAANNGAGPMWCYGAPLVVRSGGDVYVSIIETGKDVPPLCNTRWQVWRRRNGDWKVVREADEYRQREPCPLASDGWRLFVSANPSTQPPGTHYGPCEPVVWRLDALRDGSRQPTKEEPVWSPGTYFTDHSYRGFAADRDRHELLLLNINARTNAQFVSHRTADGEWRARGTIEFPIRAAYPQVALRNGAAHVLAIGDIREPNQTWRQLKREHLKRDWDYVFRRLFYAFTGSLSEEPFGTPIEIDTVEETAGHITNLDLIVDAKGAAHLLYLKQPHLHTFIRDKHFPGQPMSRTLEYVRVDKGHVALRETVRFDLPKSNAFEPSYARLHVLESGELLVVAAGTSIGKDGTGRFVNLVGSIGGNSPAKMIPLDHQFRVFFTNTVRGGSAPADTIDLFGIADDGPNLRYAEVQIGVVDRMKGAVD